MEFWESVKKAGHSEKEIENEVFIITTCLFYQIEALSKGQSWVKFN